MASETDRILALTEMIGSSSPVSNDDGKLVHSPQTAPVHNQALNKKKAPVTIDEAFMNNHKAAMMEGKNIIDMANEIGKSGLGDNLRYNDNLDEANFARNRALKALNEAIEVLGEDVIDYWAPDASTKEAAPKLKAILEKFKTRIR